MKISRSDARELDKILDRVAYKGLAVVDKYRFLRIYGFERFTIAIRRDIRERWEELQEELNFIAEIDLDLYETLADEICLLRSDRLIPDDE